MTARPGRTSNQPDLCGMKAGPGSGRDRQTRPSAVGHGGFAKQCRRSIRQIAASDASPVRRGRHVPATKSADTRQAGSDPV